MNDKYFGHKLFEKDDVIEAYGFYIYDKVSITDKEKIAIKYSNDFRFISSIIGDDEIVTRGNIKMVNNITITCLCHMEAIMNHNHYDASIIVFNPDNILAMLSYNPFKYKKLINLALETHELSTIYFYINPRDNDRLKHFIKSRYKDLIIEGDNGFHVKLTPQTKLDLIFDFIDNLLKLI